LRPAFVGDSVSDIATDIGGARMETGTENLLLKAIRSLPQDEQDEVLRSIIGQAFAAPGSSPQLHAMSGEPLHLGGPDSAMTLVPPVESVKQMTAPLLVRLPADLHDRFRRWSTTNGFSMAAVARGLIERFLNDQERTRK
jgi:hypothetical protein